MKRSLAGRDDPARDSATIVPPCGIPSMLTSGRGRSQAASGECPCTSSHVSIVQLSGMYVSGPLNMETRL